MAYFIFSNNCANIGGTLYRIAENDTDLNNLNIEKSIYKIIEDSQINFDNVKYGKKEALMYDSNNNIVYQDTNNIFIDKKSLATYIAKNKTAIRIFMDCNNHHPLFNKWKNYFDQINSLNLDSIQYPLNKSLEQYFNDLDLISLHPLQLP